MVTVETAISATIFVQLKKKKRGLNGYQERTEKVNLKLPSMQCGGNGRSLVSFMIIWRTWTCFVEPALCCCKAPSRPAFCYLGGKMPLSLAKTDIIGGMGIRKRKDDNRPTKYEGLRVAMVEEKR
jgi:hypothetical protein